MDSFDTESLKNHLLANDDEFAKLAHEHKSYDSRLSELSSLHYPSTDEQVEESLLKKKKLYLKDQMESILRRYQKQQAAGH